MVYPLIDSSPEDDIAGMDAQTSREGAVDIYCTYKAEIRDEHRDPKAFGGLSYTYADRLTIAVVPVIKLSTSVIRGK